MAGASATCSGNAGAEGTGQEHGVPVTYQEGQGLRPRGQDLLSPEGGVASAPALPRGESLATSGPAGLPTLASFKTSPPRQKSAERAPGVLPGRSQSEVRRCGLCPDHNGRAGTESESRRACASCANSCLCFSKAAPRLLLATSTIFIWEVSCFNPAGPPLRNTVRLKRKLFH